MKSFLAIIGAALVLFIGGAMLEERETFSRNWFKPQPVERGTAQERRAAADAVYLFRTLSAHLYASSGDARFAERLPASSLLVDELRADIAYLRRNGRIETPKLVRIEFLSADVSDGTRAEVTTREFWVTQHHWTGGAESDPPRSDITYARYRLTRDGARWTVTAWDPVDAPDAEVQP
jgi:hypothetical protein